MSHFNCASSQKGSFPADNQHERSRLQIRCAAFSLTVTPWCRPLHAHAFERNSELRVLYLASLLSGRAPAEDDATRVEPVARAQMVGKPRKVANAAGIPNTFRRTRLAPSARPLRARRSGKLRRHRAHCARESRGGEGSLLTGGAGSVWTSRCWLRTWRHARRCCLRLQSHQRGGAEPTARGRSSTLTRARLACFAAIPLTLVSQRAGTTVPNTGGVDNPQTSISFSAVLMGEQCAPRRTAQCSIGLEREVCASDTAGFPRRVAAVGEAYPVARAEEAGRAATCSQGSGRAGANSVMRSGSGWSCCPNSSLRFQTRLRNALPGFLPRGGVAAPSVGVLLSVFVCKSWRVMRRDAGTTRPHRAQ